MDMLRLISAGVYLLSHAWQWVTMRRDFDAEVDRIKRAADAGLRHHYHYPEEACRYTVTESTGPTFLYLN